MPKVGNKQGHGIPKKDLNNFICFFLKKTGHYFSEYHECLVPLENGKKCLLSLHSYQMNVMSMQQILAKLNFYPMMESLPKAEVSRRV